MTTPLAVLVADIGKRCGPIEENRIGCIFVLMKFNSGKAQSNCLVCNSMFCDGRRKNVDIRQLLTLRCNGASGAVLDNRHNWCIVIWGRWGQSL